MNQLIPYRTIGSSPALVAAAGDRAQERFIEFFTANIRNRNTRRAYAQAVGSSWSGARNAACPRSSPCSRCTSPASRPRSNHTFRATGITAYLKNGGTLENAAAMANHASTRTTQLYDRRDEVNLDEVERIAI
jgi:integrase